MLLPSSIPVQKSTISSGFFLQRQEDSSCRQAFTADNNFLRNNHSPFFSLSPPPSFPFPLLSFSKYLCLSHFAISLSFPPLLPPPTHTHIHTHRGRKSCLECNLTLLHETPQLIPMIKEDQAVSNECPQDMLKLSPCASPSIGHKLASTHPQEDSRVPLIFTMKPTARETDC